jgi:hypothetical protein
MAAKLEPIVSFCMSNTTKSILLISVTKAERRVAAARHEEERCALYLSTFSAAAIGMATLSHGCALPAAERLPRRSARGKHRSARSPGMLRCPASPSSD